MTLCDKALAIGFLVMKTNFALDSPLYLASLFRSDERFEASNSEEPYLSPPGTFKFMRAWRKRAMTAFGGLFGKNTMNFVNNGFNYPQFEPFP